MTSRRTLSDDEISRFLAEEEENEHEREQGSDSEIEDHLSEDDIQSDFEEEFIDDEVPQQLNDTQNEDDISPPVSSDLSSSMTCSRKTNRWPMSMFYGILNIAFVNSYVIYCHNILAKNEKPLNRRGYMKMLSAQLSESWMKERLQAPTLPKHVRDSIANILPKPVVQNDTDNEEEPPAKKRRYCTFCTNKKKRMSKMTCAKCRKTVCGEHKNDVCFECLSNQI